MRKKMFIIVTLSVGTLLIIILAIHGFHSKSITPWGRDTVKQFRNGTYEILRSSDMYGFHSSDNKVYLNGITHYYDDGSDVYLMGDNNLYARVDTINGTVETHSSVCEFHIDEQFIFREKEFVELPKIRTMRNIWDIIFKK